MQTFIEFVKELDPTFTLEEECCPKCDCDPCKCKKGKKDDKKDDKKGKNPFFAKKDKKEADED